MFACMYVCMYVCMNVSMYICMYVLMLTGENYMTTFNQYTCLVVVSVERSLIQEMKSSLVSSLTSSISLMEREKVR